MFRRLEVVEEHVRYICRPSRSTLGEAGHEHVTVLRLVRHALLEKTRRNGSEKRTLVDALDRAQEWPVRLLNKIRLRNIINFCNGFH